MQKIVLVNAEHNRARIAESVVVKHFVGIGLGLTWILAILSALTQSALMLQILFFGNLVVWLPTFLVTLAMPVPEPLSEESLLLTRLTWLGRAGRSALIFALAAIYGGSVGADISAHSQTTSSSASLIRTLWRPIEVVLFFGGAPLLFWLWIDLFRAGSVERSAAVMKIVSWIRHERAASSNFSSAAPEDPPAIQDSFLYRLLLNATGPLSSALGGLGALFALALGINGLTHWILTGIGA